jgi:hypothetical protein
MQVLQEHTKLILSSKEFKQVPEATLMLLLDQTTLSCDEFELVKAAEIWAEQQAKLRGMTGDDDSIRTCLEVNILPRLRFLTMSQTEFEVGPGQKNWLTDAEKKFILDGINDKKNADGAENKIICANKIKRQKNEKTAKKMTVNPNNIYKRKSISGVISCLHFKGNGMSILGVQILSQIKSDILVKQYPEVFNTSSETYQEQIHLNLHPLTLKEQDSGSFENHLYSIDNEDIQLDFNYVNDEVPYNSVMDVIFDNPVKLIKDQAYILYAHCYNTAGFYPISGLNNNTFNGLKDLTIHKYNLENGGDHDVDNLIFSAIIVQN